MTKKWKPKTILKIQFTMTKIYEDFDIEDCEWDLIEKINIMLDDLYKNKVRWSWENLKREDDKYNLAFEIRNHQLKTSKFIERLEFMTRGKVTKFERMRYERELEA